MIIPAYDYHSDYLRSLRAFLLACRNPFRPENWRDVLVSFCLADSAETASGIISTLRRVGVSPYDLVRYRDVSADNSLTRLVAAMELKRGFLVSISHDRDRGTRIGFEDIASGESFETALSKEDILRSLRGKGGDTDFIVDFLPEERWSTKEQDSLRLECILRRFVRDNTDSSVIWLKEVYDRVRETLSTPPEEDSPEEADDALGRAQALSRLVEKGRIEGPHGDILNTLLDEQKKVCGRHGIRLVNRILHGRFRPVFEAKLESFHDIGYGSWYTSAFDWLKSVHTALDQSGLVQRSIPGCELWQGAQKVILSRLHEYEVLRLINLYDRLRAEGADLPERKKADMKHELDELLGMNLGQYRSVSPEAFQSDRAVFLGRTNELADALSELGTIDYITEAKWSKIPVFVSTIHQAKGQGFDNVIIFESVEGQFMGENRESQKEEDRVFYVGMTRARERLVLSYSDKGARVRPLKPLCRDRVPKRRGKDPLSILIEILHSIITGDDKLEQINYLMSIIKGTLKEELPHQGDKPHLKGRITIDGKPFDIAAWINYNSDGTVQVSLTNQE